MILISTEQKVFLFNSALSANKGRAFRLDVVLVYDRQMFKTIVDLNNQDYFKNKSLIYRENPGVLNIYTVQILPGKAYPPKPVDISKSKQLIGCVIFVDFSMIKGQINRKLIVGRDHKMLSIYFDDNGIQMI